MTQPALPLRATEYPNPDYFLVHISDTHLLANNGSLYNKVASEKHLRQLFEEFEASGGRPDALIFTGDLADLGEPDAYQRIRSIVDPVAERLGTEVIWVMGNHDNREHFRTHLLNQPATTNPVDMVTHIGGLRIITLDTTVPGHHYGDITPNQLTWLADELSDAAPDGTILALHHPPVPSVLQLAASVELRDQHNLAQILQGTDVRSIIGGHLHYSSSATFAGIPVSVASATCYTQDLNVPAGGTRGRDGARAFNLIHIYPTTVLHSVVPLGQYEPLDWIDAKESNRRLTADGIYTPTLPARPPVADPAYVPLDINPATEPLPTI